MAGSIITDVNVLALGAAGQAVQAGQEKTNVGNGVDFSKTMEEAVSKTDRTLRPEKELVTSTNRRTEVEKNGENKVTKETERKNPVGSENERKKVAEKIVDKAEQIKGKIKDEMGVSDEDIENAMNTLGLSLQDLVNPDNLKNLMMEISGVEDSISLLTDPNLFSQIKSVNDFATEIVGQIDLLPEELQDVLSDSDLFEQVIGELETKRAGQDDVQTVTTEQKTEGSDDDKAEEVPSLEQGVTSEVNVKTEVNTDAAFKMPADEKPEAVILRNVSNNVNPDSQVKVEVIKDDAAKADDLIHNPNLGEEKVASEADLGKTETFSGVDKSGTEETVKKEEGLLGNSRLTNAIRNAADTKEETSNAAANVQTEITNTQGNSVGDVVETVTRYSNSDANSVISQVTESIKVNISQDVTSMEMQLHPASLGTVHMQITSNNGVVTAQLVVQDEAVKAALESQLITLQETFEEQGHKVEAVEVSVANYDLNKGMNQNDNRGDGSKEQKNDFSVRGARRRNINLNDVDAQEDEDITEEDKITKDMMERNGNTLDYTV